MVVFKTKSSVFFLPSLLFDGWLNFLLDRFFYLMGPSSVRGQQLALDAVGARNIGALSIIDENPLGVQRRFLVTQPYCHAIQGAKEKTFTQ